MAKWVKYHNDPVPLDFWSDFEQLVLNSLEYLRLGPVDDPPEEFDPGTDADYRKYYSWWERQVEKLDDERGEMIGDFSDEQIEQADLLAEEVYKILD